MVPKNSKSEVQYSRQITDSNLYFTVVYLWAINNYTIFKMLSFRRRTQSHKTLGDPRRQALGDTMIVHTEERGC